MISTSDEVAQPKSTLWKFFGKKPGQTLAEFNREVEALSKDEVNELAGLAAAELSKVK